MEYNFILTDIMKTGYNPDLHDFLSHVNIPGQSFDFDEGYYRLHFYDLGKYKRKFACLFPRPLLYTNPDYCEDLEKRIKKLTQLNFNLIICEPWESRSTIIEKLPKKYLEGLNYTYWSGEESWFWYSLFKKYKDKKLNFDHTDKKFDFLYLNKTGRPHRNQLFDHIMQENLLDKSLYSFTTRGIPLDKKYELPWAPLDKYPHIGFDQDIYELPYNHAAVNIVSETHVLDETFLTEKIWKPIIAKQIFVVHGRHLVLEHLRSLGFKTFKDIFDESYDEEKDDNKRIRKIVSLCKDLKLRDWQKLYVQTEEIRQYNERHFFDVINLKNVVNKTLLGFLKFADRS